MITSRLGPDDAELWAEHYQDVWNDTKNRTEEPKSEAKPETCSQDWAQKFVAKWCEKRANDMTPLIKRCRSAYRTGPMVEPVKKFADILEKQQAEWRHHAKEFEKL